VLAHVNGFGAARAEQTAALPTVLAETTNEEVTRV
jgi:hypothetical protein